MEAQDKERSAKSAIRNASDFSQFRFLLIPPSLLFSNWLVNMVHSTGGMYEKKSPAKITEIP
jgi:hypothetical protein